MAEPGTGANWRIDRYDVVTSTQEVLRALLEAGEEVHRRVIRAGQQTRGKGQRESEWHSGPGGSYQSLALRTERLGGHVAPAIAVAIAEALEERGIQVGVKWPNDLHLREAAALAGPATRLPGKVGGVLCEFTRGHLLVGVGINVLNVVPDGAAALDDLDPDDVSGLVLAAVERATSLPDSRLPERFARFDLLAGRALALRSGALTLVGRADGVSVGGCLRLVTAEGPTEMCSGRIEEIDTAA